MCSIGKREFGYIVFDVVEEEEEEEIEDRHSSHPFSLSTLMNSFKKRKDNESFCAYKGKFLKT